MKKILLTIIALTMVAVGCGAPKAEVPKARESDGRLLQAAFTVSVFDTAFQFLDGRFLINLTNSYDIDQAGSKFGCLSIISAFSKTFPENKTLVEFYYYLSNLQNDEFVKAVSNKTNELWNQVKAAYSIRDNVKLDNDQINFANYCYLTAIKNIIEEEDFDRIASSNQGKEFEVVENRKALMSRAYRNLITNLYCMGGDEVEKAKLDVIISDAKSEKGNGMYYDEIVKYIIDKHNKAREIALEGPYRDFVK